LHFKCTVFSERELMFAMLSPVRLSIVCRLSVTFVRPTQAIENVGRHFGNRHVGRQCRHP